MQKIRTDDMVVVVTGDDAGHRGKVLRVNTKKNRLVVEGANIVKKHQRPQQSGRRLTQAGVIEYEGEIHMSNVMLLCPHTDQPTRVGFRLNAQGKKVRFSHRSGQDID